MFPMAPRWNTPICADEGRFVVARKQFGKSRLGARSWGSQSQSSLLRDDGCDVRFDGRVELNDEIDLDGGRKPRLVAGHSLRRTMNRSL